MGLVNHPLQTTPTLSGTWCGAPRLDEVVAEEPLEIRVNGAPSA